MTRDIGSVMICAIVTLLGKSESGEYSCTATSDIGSVMTRAMVTVLG